MFQKKILFIVFVTLCLVGLGSCSSDDKDAADTIGPVITLIDPAEGESFQRGKDFYVEFGLEDESGINNYKIDVHWGEGHTHKSVVVAHSEVPSNGVAWSYQKIYDDKKGLKKTRVHIHTDDISKDAKLGEYHFGVLATDMLNNESRKYITIKVIEKVVE